ncbi:MAG TPA: GNAT family protein [Candidatus Elarobacter sp.]
MQTSLRVADDVVLEPLRDEHADALAMLIEANRAQLARWFPWVAASRSVADVRAFVASVASRHAAGTVDGYAIVVNGEVGGTIDLHEIDRARTEGRLGYWLGARFQHGGVMTRAVRAMAERALLGEGFARIYLIAAVENAASRAVAERAGFALERIAPDGAPTGNGYADAAVYVLTAAALRATIADGS